MNKSDFKFTCRTCLRRDNRVQKSSQLLSLYNYIIEVNDGLTSIADVLLMTTPQLNISGTDELPQLVCTECLTKLMEVQKFQEMCLESEKHLLNMLEMDKQLAADAAAEENRREINDDDMELLIPMKVVNYTEEQYKQPPNNETKVKNEKKSNINKTSINKRQQISMVQIPNTNIGKPKQPKNEIDDDDVPLFDDDELLVPMNTNYAANEELFSMGEDSADDSYSEDDYGDDDDDIFGEKIRKKSNNNYNKYFQEKSFKCQHCNLIFQRASQLKRHARTHTGEKPYHCKYCEKSFTQGHHLVRHTRTHVGNNLYNCELCPNGYPKATMLAKHFLTHKNDSVETRAQLLAARRRKEAKLKLSLYSSPVSMKGYTSTALGRLKANKR